MSDATCAHCGDPVPPKGSTGPQATYCSRRCRSRVAYLKMKESGRLNAPKRVRDPKTCPQCDSTFIPEVTARQRFCSKRCGKLFANASWRQGRGACVEIGCENRAIARGLCRQHHPTAADWSRGTPETRQINLRRKTQQRRARTKGDADAPLIDRDQIGDRDGWRCGLCRKPVDRTLIYPDPKSPSLDHIVPLSLGGRHSRENVQISHLACNTAKSNRVTDVQLPLIA